MVSNLQSPKGYHRGHYTSEIIVGNADVYGYRHRRGQLRTQMISNVPPPHGATETADTSKIDVGKADEIKEPLPTR